jgi:hypothetical protein
MAGVGLRQAGERQANKQKEREMKMENIMIKKDDIDRIIDEHGRGGTLLGYWIALNTIAFRKGNPFIATYAILRAESSLSDRQISAFNKQLETLKMLLITRESNTRKPNTYKLLTGAYSENKKAPRQGELTGKQKNKGVKKEGN